MEQATIIDLLTNSGLKVISIDDSFIYLEDPACIFPAFDTFLDYAWLVILILTGIMLFGWGVLYIINGVKLESLFHNAKSLIMIFAILTLVKPIVEVVYGDNLFSQQCEIKQVSRTQIDELLNQRYQNLGVPDMNTQFTSEYTETQNETNTISPSEIVNVHFELHDKSTVYITQNGIKIKRGNTISTAWKNNNPGNIRATSIMYKLGAIGESNGWCVFASEQDGINAMKKLLLSNGYNGKTLRGAIYKWAPAKDSNNPERYTQFVSKSSDISPDKPMNEMSAYELEKMVRAMQKFEGWIPGTEQKL